MLIHQARNGKLLTWDGTQLKESQSVSFKDLKKLIDQKKLPKRSKESLLRKLKKLTQDGPELPDDTSGSSEGPYDPSAESSQYEAPKRARR